MYKLTIQVAKAILTRNTQIVKNMDPYAQLMVNGHKSRTKTLENIGDIPQWNESFEFTLSKNRSSIFIFVQVKDQNNIKDALIGQVTIELNLTNIQLTNGLKWYSIKFNKKPAGKIMLSINCVPYSLGYFIDSSQFQNQIPSTHPQSYNAIRSIPSVSNDGSRIIRLNQKAQISKQKRIHNSQTKLDKHFYPDKPLSIIQTKQTFYSGSKGVRPVGYSMQKVSSTISKKLYQVYPQ